MCVGARARPQVLFSMALLCLAFEAGSLPGREAHRWVQAARPSKLRIHPLDPLALYVNAGDAKSGP